MIQAPSRPRASLLGLPSELRDQILREVLLERVPIVITLTQRRAIRPGARNPRNDLYWDAEKRTWRLQARTVNATEKQKAYLLPGLHDDGGYRLISTAPIGCVSAFLRAEVLRFIRLAPLDVVAELEQFDFSHVQAFMSSLPAIRLQDFIVQETGRSTCSLTIYLHRPPGGTLGRSSANLEKWLEFIPSLFSVDGTSPELATAYRILPEPFTECYNDAFTTKSIVQMLYSKDEKRTPGPGKLDLYKIMHAWWARWRVIGYLLTGSTWTRHASPDDLNLVTLH